MPEPPDPSVSPEFGSTGDDPDPSTTGPGLGTSESSSTGEGSNEPEAKDVVWTNAQITPGCFLFVDTQTLGIEVTWIEADGQVILRFDAARHIDFVGPAWAFTQEFVGMLEDGRYIGTWSYAECNVTQAPELCPAYGGCTGAANFEITTP